MGAIKDVYAARSGFGYAPGMLTLLTATVLVFVYVAIISMSPIIWLTLVIACVAICVVVEKSKTKNTAAKLGVALLGCGALIGLVLFAQVWWFWEKHNNVPKRAANLAYEAKLVQQSREELNQLLNGTDPQRFSKALTIAQSQKNADQIRTMTLDIHHKLSSLSGAAPLAETEIEAAQSAAYAIRSCPGFVPTALVRQIQPADFLRVLKITPDRHDCNGRDLELVQRVMERCKGPWAGRCANELPQGALLLESELRNVADPRYPNLNIGERTERANAIRQLIQAVWPQQKLDRMKKSLSA